MDKLLDYMDVDPLFWEDRDFLEENTEFMNILLDDLNDVGELAYTKSKVRTNLVNRVQA